MVDGLVTEALVYSIASEGNYWDHCHFQLAEQAPARHLLYLSRHDDLDVDHCADQVNTVHTFVACTFNNLRARNGVDDDEVDAVYINTAGCQYALFVNCYLVTDAGCFVRLSVPDSGFGPIHFLGCGNELFRAGPVKAGLIIETPNHNQPTLDGLWFDNSAFAFQAQPAVLVTEPMTLENFRYNFMSSNGAGGALRLQSLANSEIRIRDNAYYDGAEHGRIVEIAGDARNNTFYGPLHQFVVRGVDVGNVYRDTTTAGLSGQRRPVLAQVQDYTLPRNLAGLVLSNSGATQPVVFRLPPAEPGLHFTIVKAAAPAVRVAAAEGDVLGDASQPGWHGGPPLLVNQAAGETAASLTLVAADDRLWVVTSQAGTWEPAAR
jgi:hypothetical protein